MALLLQEVEPVVLGEAPLLREPVADWDCVELPLTVLEGVMVPVPLPVGELLPVPEPLWL